MTVQARLKRLLRPVPVNPDEGVFQLTDEDRRYLTTLHDESVPLPAGAEIELATDSPRLRELRESYAELDLPVLSGSRWRSEFVEGFLDLRYFRGETLITWHYRELPRITALKYFLLMTYVRERDTLGLLSRLQEDGAFGCWTFDYEGHGRFSRDLLESVNEISFLERALDLSGRERFSVLDVGAGYGRLAHRMLGAFPALADYCCVDAVPESTFICEYYLRHRGLTPRGRAVPLPAFSAEVEPGTFDLAINIHSFPEQPYASVQWWIGELHRLQVPQLLIVPNDRDELLTQEPDGARRDFGPILAQAGYELSAREPVITDPAVRTLLELHDEFQLFTLKPGS